MRCTHCDWEGESAHEICPACGGTLDAAAPVGASAIAPVPAPCADAPGSIDDRAYVPPWLRGLTPESVRANKAPANPESQATPAATTPIADEPNPLPPWLQGNWWIPRHRPRQTDYVPPWVADGTPRGERDKPVMGNGKVLEQGCAPAVPEPDTEMPRLEIPKTWPSGTESYDSVASRIAWNESREGDTVPIHGVEPHTGIEEHAASRTEEVAPKEMAEPHEQPTAVMFSAGLDEASPRRVVPDMSEASEECPAELRPQDVVQPILEETPPSEQWDAHTGILAASDMGEPTQPQYGEQPPPTVEPTHDIHEAEETASPSTEVVSVCEHQAQAIGMRAASEGEPPAALPPEERPPEDIEMWPVDSGMPRHRVDLAAPVHASADVLRKVNAAIARVVHVKRDSGMPRHGVDLAAPMRGSVQVLRKVNAAIARVVHVKSGAMSSRSEGDDLPSVSDTPSMPASHPESVMHRSEPCLVRPDNEEAGREVSASEPSEPVFVRLETDRQPVPEAAIESKVNAWLPVEEDVPPIEPAAASVERSVPGSAAKRRPVFAMAAAVLLLLATAGALVAYLDVMGERPRTAAKLGPVESSSPSAASTQEVAAPDAGVGVGSSDGRVKEEALAAREPSPPLEPSPSLEPSGPIATAVPASPESAPAPLRTRRPGRVVFNENCAGCHNTGRLGGPRLNDVDAWSPRLARGKASLYASAIRGKGAMKARGGNPALDDEDVKAAVDYMTRRAEKFAQASAQRAKPAPVMVQAPASPQLPERPTPSAHDKDATPEWLVALRGELQRCRGGGFVERILCNERARWRYCDPHGWGTTPECPKVTQAEFSR